jgi:hypothetical protein
MADIESPRADVELTEAERDYFKANLRANLGYRAYVIEDTMVRHVERILADRLAAVQAEREVLAQQYEAEIEELEADVIAEETRANENATLVHEARAERDDLRARLAERDQQVVDTARDLGTTRARLLAVETLADAAAIFVGLHPDDETKAVSRLRDALRAFRSADRAVLASPSTHTQRDTETAAQALRDAADFIEATSGIGRRASDYADGWYDALASALCDLRARADSLAAREEQP